MRKQGHGEVRQAFHQNSSPGLIWMCDENSREIKINTIDKETNNNMKHCGEQVIMEVGQMATFPVK